MIPCSAGLCLSRDGVFKHCPHGGAVRKALPEAGRDMTICQRAGCNHHFNVHQNGTGHCSLDDCPEYQGVALAPGRAWRPPESGRPAPRPVDPPVASWTLDEWMAFTQNLGAVNNAKMARGMRKCAELRASAPPSFNHRLEPVPGLLGEFVPEGTVDLVYQAMEEE
jgi:hypothetical protein